MDEFIQNCYPLVDEYEWVDMHIDFCEDTFTDNCLNKLKSKRITYGVVENRGVDVLPYIKYLYQHILNKNEYSVITKIHSKMRNNGIRKTAYIPMVSNKKKFKQFHNLIEEAKIPVILTNQYMVSNQNEPRIAIMLNDMINILKLTNKNGRFVHGTMFMTSTLYLNKLFNVEYKDIEYKFEKGKPNLDMHMLWKDYLDMH